MNLEIKTGDGYNSDMFVESVRIEQGDTAIKFDRIMDSALKITEDRVYQYAFGTYKEDGGEAHISSGCKLDFEVVTPEPRISVEVSNQEVYDGNADYATWTFTSSRIGRKKMTFD